MCTRDSSPAYCPAWDALQCDKLTTLLELAVPCTSCDACMLRFSSCPGVQDGEVESFQRLPLKDVAAIIAQTDDFKDNCNLVIISFLVRHGFLKPEQPGYLGIVSALLSGDCS